MLVAITNAAKNPYIARAIINIGNPPYCHGVMVYGMKRAAPQRTEDKTNPIIPQRYTITAL